MTAATSEKTHCTHASPRREVSRRALQFRSTKPLEETAWPAKNTLGSDDEDGVFILENLLENQAAVVKDLYLALSCGSF